MTIEKAILHYAKYKVDSWKKTDISANDKKAIADYISKVTTMWEKGFFSNDECMRMIVEVTPQKARMEVER